MKCSQCHKEINNELDMVLINVDGDFVCSKQCQSDYEVEKNHFLNNIIHDDRKYSKWISEIF